jgi:dissimilatory sulfite reductase (desulfoviridin) alpha/beta subunit
VRPVQQSLCSGCAAAGVSTFSSAKCDMHMVGIIQPEADDEVITGYAEHPATALAMLCLQEHVEQQSAARILNISSDTALPSPC